MPRSKQAPLTPFYNDGHYTYEIGIDEAGRGPLFGARIHGSCYFT